MPLYDLRDALMRHAQRPRSAHLATDGPFIYEPD